MFPSTRTGDFAEDVPLECPATTTCPVICVANVSDCPTNCDAGLTLCKTGHCQPNCDDDNDDRSDNPCLCEQLNVACAKTVDLYPVCNERFQQFYDNNTECVDGQIDFVELISFAGPWFLVCYIGFGGLAILVVVWCFLNQKVFPVKSSTMPLKAAKAAKQELNEVWSQTGYKTTILGTTIYILVEFSFLAIQFLLLLTTLFYYMQQGAINWPPVFHDEVQVLKSFQIVWMSGFLWSFAFRYPSTGTKSLFLRRCDLSEATHVAVVAPIKLCHRNGNVQSFVGRAASMIWEPIDFVCRFYFSFPYDKPGTETIFCPIATDLPTGTRSVLHRMRHYVYDEEVKSFAPLALNVGRTVGDLLGQSNGLSQEEANRRRGTYGPNIIPLTKPTVLGSLYKELRKPFYLYQNFMVWTWANFFYYDMALVHTVVRLLGACFVAYYQHLSDCTAYGLSKVGGSAT